MKVFSTSPTNLLADFWKLSKRSLMRRVNTTQALQHILNASKICSVTGVPRLDPDLNLRPKDRSLVRKSETVE